MGAAPFSFVPYFATPYHSPHVSPRPSDGQVAVYAPPLVRISRKWSSEGPVDLAADPDPALTLDPEHTLRRILLGQVRRSDYLRLLWERVKCSRVAGNTRCFCGYRVTRVPLAAHRQGTRPYPPSALLYPLCLGNASPTWSARWRWR